ncbi:MAG: peptide MFS transporter [Bacteroidales bacterium]|nr:peptide MFS transporter [Bacteroidales bacterium]
MLKGHPRGLLVAFFANMGERFGYYTMIAIFVLFLQAKYGFEYAKASQYFGIFLACVYFLPLFGGIIADRLLGYGKTISLGLIVMFIGYLMIAIPTTMDGGLPLIIAGLAVISMGTGLFKGNLQALVGNLYDDPKYSKRRDVAFNIFYMGINIGAMFAPTAAESISNMMLKRYDLFYKANIPALAHKYMGGDTSVAESLQGFAAEQPAYASFGGDLIEFSQYYINHLAESYHWAFGVACISLIISMAIFWGFRKHYKHADLTEKQKSKDETLRGQMVVLTPAQVKERMIALFLVFFVAMFFWMSFHQNGAAMTAFARDYTVDSVGRFTNIWFDLFGLLPIFLSLIGLIFVIRKKSTGTQKLIGAIAFFGFAIIAYLRISGYSESNDFTPQKFQHFNPFFIVVLTPLVVGFFTWLASRDREPSAPKKIGIGMIITSVGFTVMVFGSLSLMGYSPGDIGEIRAPDDRLIGPYWLITTYFTLTIAELFLSPMALSFISKVSPPQYKGMMQGAWLAATAIGNYGVAVVGILWNRIQLWMFWGILVVACLLAATFIFSILKRLEKATET